MARLPDLFRDRGKWGSILLDFLRVSHNEDGSLKSDAVGAAVGDAIEDAIEDALADNQTVIDVRRSGAVGDGETIDTDAIRSAITACGEGGTLLFPPNHTFLIDGSLRPLPNQTWIAYGATLKRCDVRSSLTTAPIVAGDSTIQVADPSQFRVGMTVSVFNGTTYSTSNFDITAINGDTLSLTATVGMAFPVGSTVYSSFEMIKGGSAYVPGFKLYGLTFDGNRGNNALLARWQNHAEVNLWSDRMVIRDCYSFDAQCEVFEFNGDDVTIVGNVITNAGGNGIHMGNTHHTKIIGNSIVNANLAGTDAGHQDGCISASNDVYDTEIVGNYLEGGISAIGSWDASINTGLTVVGNTIRNCLDYAFEMRCPSGQWTEDIIIANNRIYDSVMVSILTTKSAPADDEGPRRILINSNYLVNTYIYLQRVFNVVVDANSLYFTASPATVSGIAVVGSGGKNTSVTNNQVRGAKYGIFVDHGTPCLVANNTVINAATRGINGSGKTTIRGNLVTSEEGVDTGYIGIVSAAGDVVDGNTIVATVGAYGVYCPSASSETTGAIVTNNVIRTPSGMPSVRADGGSYNNYIMRNFITQAVSNGSENNVVDGNVTIPT